MAVEEVTIFIAVICGDLRCLLAEREGGRQRVGTW